MNAPRLIEGDCLVELPKLAAAGERYHAVVTDPPYHLTNRTPDVKWCTDCHRVLGGRDGNPDRCPKCGGSLEYQRTQGNRGFMGKQWDGGDIAFRPETWRAVYDVLLPGGYMVCFASTRGYHRMVCAIEDAGFVIHPMIAWVTSQGFPKATDVGRMIDKQAGAEREIIGPATYTRGATEMRYSETRKVSYDYQPLPLTAPATPEAAQWEGWKYGLQSLKPAIEPICLAQRPPEKGGMIPNILKHGTGALNIDATRIPATDSQLAEKYASVRNAGPRDNAIYGSDKRARSEGNIEPNALGRWPANLVHDGSAEVEAAFAAFGSSTSSAHTRHNAVSLGSSSGGIYGDAAGFNSAGVADAGTASRFFTQCPFTEDELRFHYSGKADKGDRADSKHPTVKPVSLLKWLVTLITPPGGHVCDPFAGSGGVAEACTLLGFDSTLIERDPTHAEDIRHRIKR